MHNPYLLSGLIILGYMLVWYTLAQWKKDNSIVDIGWGFGFVLLAFLLEYTFGLKPNLVLWIVAIWGLRLSIYLYFRNKNKDEDWRYQEWRKEWGKWAPVYALFKVFLLQGAFLWVIALPITASAGVSRIQAGWIWWLLPIGVLFWITGFLWEAIADGQLYRFKANPDNRGKILRSGLWGYSRHPNYFGEILLWWGIFLIAMAGHGQWWTIISPMTITWLLNRVSGVPMLEKKYADNPEYQEYINQTNALIPKFF